MTQLQLDNWTSCYDLNWKGLICDEAFSHPAKYSRGLIFRIIEHALEDGLIQPGQTILDPFGGVALGALPALMNGLNWIGCELEPRFCELGRQNIDLWNRRFSGMPKWTGEAILIRGDSRRLAEVVGGAGCVVSSPPYAESVNQSAGANDTEARIERMRAAGIDVSNRANVGGPNGVARTDQTYGQTDGQLGAMKSGDISAVISSPPFAGNSGGRGEASRNGIDPALFDRHSGGMKKGTGADPANLDHLPQGSIAAVIGSPPFADSVGSDDPDKRGGLFRDEKRRNDTNLTGTYGQTEGQLGAMTPGNTRRGMKPGVAVVGSPPFENSLDSNDSKFWTERTKLKNEWQQNRSPESVAKFTSDYGSTDGQIGAAQGDTFWSAAKTIIDQCYQILPPNAAAIWILKGYIKNGKYVDFPGQWQALCEACGFETVHIHRAMLVKENGAQGNMFGADKNNKTERKSFFRRLAEAAKKAEAHWETLSNADRAALIAAAYVNLFEHYLAKLREHGETKPAAITKTRLMREAKSKAWLRDGRPDYQIATAIDFETVLCTRKAA